MKKLGFKPIYNNLVIMIKETAKYILSSVLALKAF